MEICRACLKVPADPQQFSTFLLCDRETVTILEAFERCFQVTASEDDLLCLTCRHNLEGFFNFIQKVKENDSKYQELYGFKRSTDRTIFGKTIPSEGAESLELSYTKDPLEDSDLEIDINQESNSVPKSIKSNKTENINDSDEDKPLIEFINEGHQNSSVEDSKTPESQKNEDSFLDDYGQNFDSDSLSDDDDFAESLEEKIFPQGTFKCSICSKTYFTEIGLETHNEIHLQKDSTLKKKQSRGPYKRRRKVKDSGLSEINDDQVKLKEESCTKSEPHTSSKGNKQKLLIQKSKIVKPKKLYPCQYCGKELISASKLRYHLVMHTGEKNFLCTICPKAYSTIYALKHHMRTHTGERPYECKFCGDRFLRPTTLKSHMRRHTGERPYGCEICGKRFIQHSSMATHMKLNHMDKTIQCPHCDKKYARKIDLNMHLLSHTGDKPFACKLCSSRFIRQANLNKHINSHHSNIKDKLNGLSKASSPDQFDEDDFKPNHSNINIDHLEGALNQNNFNEHADNEIILSSIVMK